MGTEGALLPFMGLLCLFVRACFATFVVFVVFNYCFDMSA